MTEIGVNFQIVNVLIATLGWFGWVVVAFILLMTGLYVAGMTRKMISDFKASEMNALDFLLVSKRKVFGIIFMLGLFMWTIAMATTYQPRVYTTTTNPQLERTLQEVRTYKPKEIPPAEADKRGSTFDSLAEQIRKENERVKEEFKK